MNFFKNALPFVDTKSSLDLDNVYVTEEYAYATDRYVAVRTRHHAVVPDPVLIPLDITKKAAKVKSVVTNIDTNPNIITFADGTEIPFAEPETSRYPNLDRIFESFVPSAHTSPLEFDAHRLALFAKWFTRKQAQETPLHLDFNSRGVLRVRPDTDTVAIVAPTRFT